MNAQDTLDKSSGFRLFGLDLKINRFHLINPIDGELMICKLRSNTYGWIWQSFVLFIIGLVPLLISYNMYTVVGVDSMMIFFALIGSLLILLSGSNTYMALSKKSSWHFSSNKLIYTNSFGWKKVVKRSDVISVYVSETTGKSRAGIEKYIRYELLLRIKPKGLNFGAYSLFILEEPDTKENVFLNSINTNSAKVAEQDALQIASIIAEYWKIPVSV